MQLTMTLWNNYSAVLELMFLLRLMFNKPRMNGVIHFLMIYLYVCYWCNDADPLNSNKSLKVFQFNASFSFKLSVQKTALLLMDVPIGQITRSSSIRICSTLRHVNWGVVSENSYKISLPSPLSLLKKSRF